MLDPNFTIVPQMLLFALAMYFIQTLILKPYSDSLRLREGAVEGAKGGADTAGDEAQELRRAYEAKLDAARVESERIRATARAEARGEEQRVLDEVTASSAKALESARADLRARVETTRGGLDSEARTLARELAEAALGRSL